MQQITITKVKNKDSNQITFNVDLEGIPFGQIWTFKAKGEKHRYHAKTLRGGYANFATYKEAEAAIRKEM